MMTWCSPPSGYTISVYSSVIVPRNLRRAGRKWDFLRYAMKQTPEILARFNFPAEKIPVVVEAIRTHQPKDNPTSIEGIILRDADILKSNWVRSRFCGYRSL